MSKLFCMKAVSARNCSAGSLPKRYNVSCSPCSRTRRVTLPTPQVCSVARNSFFVPRSAVWYMSSRRMYPTSKCVKVLVMLAQVHLIRV